jgi:serine/threonine-protein kinase
VPDVDEYFDYSAREILENRGFQARIVYEYREGYADRGVAWGTDPAIGTLVPYGTTVTVYATPKDEYQPQIRT